MGYQLAAELTLIIHLFFIIFILFGGLLALRKRFWIWLHIPAALWGLWIEWSGWICPLTPLENYFRQKASLLEYPEGFIEHYLISIIYPEQLTISLQWFLGGILLIVNLLIYFYVFRTGSKHQYRVDE
jgi:hypothetical protein